MKKLLLFVVILFISFSWVSYAVSKFNYESALQIANEYITNSSFDENWKDHNPTIIEKWKEFHTDDDSKISYIEFKVSCDNNPDCWFVMVNFDWDDVTVPIASTSWNTPSEVLIAQNGGIKEDNKLYYFSPFDMYGENIKTEEVSSIDPVDNINKTLEQDTKLTKEQKQEKRIKHKNELKNRIIKAKKDAWDYKKTYDFKNKRQELRDKKQAIPKEEVSYKILPFLEYANADTEPLNNWWYTPITASNIFVSWSSTTNCKSRIPCYVQYSTTYNNKPASSWCTPTAVAMIYWYYDRQGTFPNLVSWTAVDVTTKTSMNTNIKSMIDSLKTYMGTYYKLNDDWTRYEWATSIINHTWGILYAINKWYKKSVSKLISWNSSTLFSTIKTEINNGRPVMLNTDTHSIVIYWYNSTITTANIVRANLWWGSGSTLIWIDNKTYYTSNIDYNMNYIYYNATNHTSKSVVTFKLAQ